MRDSPPDDAPRTRRGLVVAATAAVAALVVAAVVMVIGAAGDGGDGEGGAATGALGGALATAGTGTSLPGNAGTVATVPTTAGADTPDGSDDPDDAPAGADLPPVTIPAESSPPTTIPGSEPSSIPTDIFSGEEAPEFGTLVVDLEEGGYQDFAVHLRADQEVSLLSLGDDGIRTDIEVFAPDGTSEGRWSGGEPGVVNGVEWYRPEEPLPATGTYVIRVIHTGGSHEPFALGFFGTA